MNWITSHWVEIFAVAFAVEKAAGVIVKLTPTPKDDSIYNFVNTWLTKAANILNVKPKE